jgi:hypothetical protein
MSEELEHAGYDIPRPRTSPNPVTHYFRTLAAILTHPSRFFRDLPRPTGFVGPLFFGILTSWFGSALEYLWYSGFGHVFRNRWNDLLNALEKVPQIDSSGQFESALAMRQKVTDWVFGVGSVLIDPFKSCAWILFLSVFVWIAARLFADRDYVKSENRLGFETALSIVAFSQAASLFKGVPVLGGLISVLFAMVLGTIGAKQTYRVTTSRALVIVLFPSILFWGMLIAGVVAFFSAILMFFLHA